MRRHPQNYTQKSEAVVVDAWLILDATVGEGWNGENIHAANAKLQEAII